ncbi:MAG: ferredoxin [Patescibacteria group bacterium]
MKASVNKDTCIGCALCSGIAEDIFEMDYDAGKAVVKKNAKIGPDNKERAKDAEKNCPVGAIGIKE